MHVAGRVYSVLEGMDNSSTQHLFVFVRHSNLLFYYVLGGRDINSNTRNLFVSIKEIERETKVREVYRSV